MAIRIKTLEELANNYTENKYLYKDLYLDISQTKIESPGFALSVPGKDIRADFDIGAIINSLTNLFNTLPGQRFLFPEYGLNLTRYLFEPITEFNARNLGNRIFQSISIFETRVKPLNVDVGMDIDNNQYNISILIEIPILQQTTEVSFLLNTKKQNIIFLPTSKNK
jgi:phage baseplate assembly protein W